MSLITTVTRKTIMQQLVLNLKSRKTSLGFVNLVVKNCGQHEGPNTPETCLLH